MNRKQKLMILILVSSIFMLISTRVSAEKEFEFLRTIETPSPKEHGWFGSPLDISNELILVSSYQADIENVQNVGKAYLFNLDGELVTTYHSEKPQSGGYFSRSLDISGDRVLIGDSSSKDEWRYVGKVYFFDTDGNQIKVLEAPEPSRGAEFGYDVRFAPNRIIISEKGGLTEPSLAGKVYIFDDEGNHLKTIYSPSPKSSAYFGLDIETGDDLFLVNEVGDGQILFPGTVYGFDYDGNHILTLQAPEPEDRACFGNSMDISGDKIIIGEYYATVDGKNRAGKAYLFSIDGEHLQTFESPSPESTAIFGFAVSLEGDTVVIGSPDADVNPNMNEGKAYIFDVDGTLLQTLISPSPYPIGIFGRSVDIEGENIVVGEPWAEVDGEMRAGVIHIYSTNVVKAEFSFANLKVSSEKVFTDKPVTITVDCINSGTISGSTAICMHIDEEMVEEKTVTVDAGQIKTVTFTYSADEEGTHQVAIEDLVSDFEVEVEKPDNGDDMFFVAIAAGLVVITFLVYFLTRKR